MQARVLCKHFKCSLSRPQAWCEWVCESVYKRVSACVCVCAYVFRRAQVSVWLAERMRKNLGLCRGSLRGWDFRSAILVYRSNLRWTTLNQTGSCFSSCSNCCCINSCKMKMSFVKVKFLLDLLKGSLDKCNGSKFWQSFCKTGIASSSLVFRDNF